MSGKGEVIVRFDGVSFKYGHNKPILDEVSFTVRRGSKIALMGQNGAGKSTIFNLITKGLEPEDGEIHSSRECSISIAPQVIPRDELNLTVREFFEKCFDKKVYNIDPKIDEVLKVVSLSASKDKIINDFSGGQQARLLLASALIQNPGLLLLDEPTNNLDKEGIEHLKRFLINYEKSIIVISHDAKFLNSFTGGVLYLDFFTRKIEKYVGDYNDVVREIVIRVEKELKKNAQLEKSIQAKKDKANFFAKKGGGMRLVAKHMRESAEEAEASKVDVRREDKPIKKFNIEVGEHHVGEILHIESLSIMKNGKVLPVGADISLRKKGHLLLSGPNGIGKSTLLEHLANGTEKGAKISEGVKVGYYRQDFSTLDFNESVYSTLGMYQSNEQTIRSVAAGFLITAELMHVKVGNLSEGQKGLVAFTRLVLLKPSLLILDEPTNHINFRHLPIIAKALDEYEGAMILVSHVPEFVEQIRIDERLDLDKLRPLK